MFTSAAARLQDLAGDEHIDVQNIELPRRNIAIQPSATQELADPSLVLIYVVSEVETVYTLHLAQPRCYRLHLLDFFSLRLGDRPAERNEFGIGEAGLTAHQDRARVMRDHGGYELAVVDEDLGARRPK